MKVVVADANLRPHRELLESSVPPGIVVKWYTDAGDPRLPEAMPDAEVFVGSTLPGTLAGAATSLRLVLAAGAGTDGIDMASLPAGVACANTYHHERSIAEYVAAALVVLRRGTLSQDAALRRGVWSSPVYDPAQRQPRSLAGGVATLLGFGHIGQAVWSLLRAFGVEGIAVTATGSAHAAAHGLRWVGELSRLDEALDQSDVLVISVPLLASTRDLVTSAQLNRLGTAGLLVNVARGPIVHQKDLFDALRDRRIAGAALDVWYRYPTSGAAGDPADFPFGELDNVLMTPHSSGITADTFAGRAREIADNITRLSLDRPLQNLVHLS